MRISFIVPALNEADQISSALSALAPLRAAGHEIVVVDGGSGDGTAVLAEPLADRVVGAPRGRASQMNVGAAFASGDVLLFLHADSRLPVGAVDSVERAVASGAVWGRFDVAIDGRSRILPLVAQLMNLRSRLTGVATGDQGIFVQRALFESIGGYPLQPLMEDIELSSRLKRLAGAPACLRERIVTSGRRWDGQGPLRTVARMSALRYAYWRGVDPGVLANRYGTARALPAPTLQVFAREPRPGQVKTRLAAEIGAEEAARVYRSMVELTLATAQTASKAGIVGRVELWCAPDIASPVFGEWRSRYGVDLMQQQGSDLGERMRNALNASLARQTPAILIGTDCPALDVRYLGFAAAHLADHDVVLGPAEDGGYVLVGLSQPVDLFAGIDWGTRDVMAATRARLQAQRGPWHELPTLWDIDTAADLDRWRSQTAAKKGQMLP